MRRPGTPSSLTDRSSYVIVPAHLPHRTLVYSAHRLGLTISKDRPGPLDATLYYMVNLGETNGSVDVEIRASQPDHAQGRTVARLPSARILALTSVMQPVISPDGKTLAMSLIGGATTNIYGLSTRDGTLRRITDFGRQATFIARSVSWSSEGRTIYASVGRSEFDVVWLSQLLP